MRIYLTILSRGSRCWAPAIFAFCIFHSAFSAAAVAAEPALARLTFKIDPARKAEFSRLFDATLRPILERHGLRKTSVVPPTPIVDSLVSRAVEIDHPGDILPKNLALQEDRNWNSQLEKFGAHNMTQERDRTSTVIWQRYALTIWRASGNGRRVQAGPGRGRWQTYDAGGKAMFKDRDGNLWFGDKGEVKRFDGFTWTRFGPEDGLEVLPSNSIYEIYQSRDGAMWFGARNALTRFDGSSWQNYGEEHGLDEDINHIVEDAAGRMLVDGSRGVSTSLLKGDSTCSKVGPLGSTRSTQAAPIHRMSDSSRTYSSAAMALCGLAHSLKVC